MLHLASAVWPLVLVGMAAAAPAAHDPRYHAADSDIAKLFRRAPNPNDANFSANYPTPFATPPTASIPQAWLNKLNSLTLPSFGPSTSTSGAPVYPNGTDAGGSYVCSFSYGCHADSDLFAPPNGTIALTFDDGPSDGSEALYQFLQSNNVSAKATHFLIGSNVLSYPYEFQKIAASEGLMCDHTWSHPWMTTKSNQDVVAELGWSMQIISDLNGGRLPKFWRPPYGDVDNRVRAIAQGVFGLTTVVWNHDSADWAIGNNPAYTNASVDASMTQWITGSKSPGLCILEHELSTTTVGVFMRAFPQMVSNGWNILNVADAWSLPWYQNAAKGNDGPVTTMAVGGNLALVNGSTSTTSSSTSASSSSTSKSASTTTMMSSSSTTTTSTVTSTSTSTSASAAAATSSKSAAQHVVSSGGLLAVLGALSAMLL